MQKVNTTTVPKSASFFSLLRKFILWHPFTESVCTLHHSFKNVTLCFKKVTQFLEEKILSLSTMKNLQDHKNHNWARKPRYNSVHFSSCFRNPRVSFPSLGKSLQIGNFHFTRLFLKGKQAIHNFPKCPATKIIEARQQMKSIYLKNNNKTPRSILVQILSHQVCVDNLFFQSFLFAYQ